MLTQSARVLEPIFSVPPHATSSAFNGHAVAHGFFGRRGGVSVHYFDSLNAGFFNGDNPLNIRDNRAMIATALQVEAPRLWSLKQTHSNICVIPDNIAMDHPDNRPEGDALATDQPGLGIGVLSADCAPVLFSYNGTKPVVGAAHAGWQGAVSGVLEATLEKMEELGAQRGEIVAAVGPCIAQKSYEVSNGFEEPFIQEDPSAAQFFIAGQSDDKLMFDLAGYCAFRLARVGVGHIDIIDHDTCALENEYFSHRRMSKTGEVMRGVQLSAISIKSP